MTDDRRARTRHDLIDSYDDIRSSFLAALDQIIVELRPRIKSLPGYYQESIRACAYAFSDPDLVAAQLSMIQPDILDGLHPDDLADAHLSAVAYLFSVALHELIRQPSATSTEGAP